MQPFRLSLVGALKGPHLFDIVELIGKDETITLPLVSLRPYQKEIQDKLFQEGYKRFFLVRPRRAGKEMESWNLLIQGALT